MGTIRVVQGDITRLEVDAIVNAANQAMLGGGGVDGAIHRAAGPELLEACRAVPQVRPRVRCPTGDARLTPGFRLPAKYVVHTVGPVWNGGYEHEPELLESCYRESLSLAAAHGARSIAFPAISCGVFRFPLAQACRIAVTTLQEELDAGADMDEVLLVGFSADVVEALQTALDDAISS